MLHLTQISKFHFLLDDFFKKALILNGGFRIGTCFTFKTFFRGNYTKFIINNK